MGAYTAAQAIDGWKCIGRGEGDLARTHTREQAVAELRANIKAASEAREQKKTGGPTVAPPTAPSIPAATTEPTWATGE